MGLLGMGTMSPTLTASARSDDHCRNYNHEGCASALGARVRELGAIAVAIQKFPMEDVAGSRLMLRVLGRFDARRIRLHVRRAENPRARNWVLLFSAIPPAFVLQRFQKCPETRLPARLLHVTRGRRLDWSGFGEASCVPASWTASAGYSALFVTPRVPADRRNDAPTLHRHCDHLGTPTGAIGRGRQSALTGEFKDNRT
jgi:hypothetical protein